MTAPMTLTVRLDPSLELALERHCADRGVTKSVVVQESLVAYLRGTSTADANRPAGDRELSPAFLAFQRAGFIGTGTLGGASADKAAVRARAAQRLSRPSK